jgi:hypothetical protein
MCIAIQPFFDILKDLYSVSKLPFYVFVISITVFIFSIGSSYAFGLFFERVSLALIAGSIFYFFTNSLLRYQQKKFARKFAIDRYCSIKFEMINRLLGSIKGRRRISCTHLKDNINNYEIIRKCYITDSLRNEIANNLDRTLVKETLFCFNQLKEILAFLSAYDFVKSNDKLCERNFYLNLTIDDFKHNVDMWYSDNDTAFYKIFDRVVIGYFLLGFDLVDGEKKEDEFLELLKNS